jgi:hypothetical protein
MVRERQVDLCNLFLLHVLADESSGRRIRGIGLVWAASRKNTQNPLVMIRHIHRRYHCHIRHLLGFMSM